MAEWRYVRCGRCRGYGIVGVAGLPSDCGTCAGNGGYFVTERGAMAMAPGGPFLGRATRDEWESGEPIESEGEGT